MLTAGNSPQASATYVLDSFAVLAFLGDEPGADRVSQLLEIAADGTCNLYMCAVNLGEVLYIEERERGLAHAQDVLARLDELPIEIIAADRMLALGAVHVKAECPIAYADCFAAALSLARRAPLVTGDPEFAKIKPESNLRIEWIVELKP